VARKALGTVEKPTVDALGELARELRSRAGEKGKDDSGVN
jgi:hypothetical protein